MRALASLHATLEPYEDLGKRLAELQEYVDLLADEGDPAMAAEVAESARTALADLDRLEFETLLSGEHDAGPAILTTHAGAGGTESCDWAEMLLRMYSRWSQQRGMSFEVIDESPGDVTGYRSASAIIEGRYAYGYLRAERGVHRLVRISPYDAAGKRHTSFAMVEVIPEVAEGEVSVKLEELKIDTFRSSGAGGQHVNKTDSAVRITHIPTGIVVTCQNERSQHKNRAVALKVLESRVAELERDKSEQKLRMLRGEVPPAEWGHQIRSYVLHPYTMVKDHRTGHETANTVAVLDGDVTPFMEAFLRMAPGEQRK
jgi:peptide chain release factor 2